MVCVYSPIKRGDIDQSSFAFTLNWEEKADHWENEDGIVKRTILNIDKVYDISPVTYPAYKTTTVDARAMDKVKEFEPKEERSGEIEILELENELLRLR